MLLHYFFLIEPQSNLDVIEGMNASITTVPLQKRACGRCTLLSRPILLTRGRLIDASGIGVAVKRENNALVNSFVLKCKHRLY